MTTPTPPCGARIPVAPGIHTVCALPAVHPGDHSDTVPTPRVEWDGDRPEFIHICNGVPTREPIPLRRGGWTADRALDSVSPSIDCRACSTHGFWTAGEWRAV